MGIKMSPSAREIAAEMRKYEERVKRVVIRRLQHIGEQVVNKCRTGHTYTDRTGNLTSSMGYAIGVDGKVVQLSSFSTVNQGQQGVDEGRDYAKELVAQHPHGICLIVVAGMDYASYVSDRGYDVLDGGKLLADRLVQEMARQIAKEIDNL